MPSNEQRVAALETNATGGDESIRIIIGRLGETAAEAKRRDGGNSSERQVIVVTFT